MTKTSQRDRFTGLLFALCSGLLLGCAFPPVDWNWLVWVGLIPLLLAVQYTKSLRRAFFLGLVAGFMFFAIVLHPLVSVHSWTGWIRETQTAFNARLSHQWWFMHGIWMAFSVWCALFWGLWAAGVKMWGRGRWSQTAAAVALWIVLPEGLRAQTTFGCEWAFLGNACAHLGAIRQLAAVGGVRLLSALVLLINVGIVALLIPSRRRQDRWAVPLVAAAWLSVVWVHGMRILRAPLSSSGSVAVAAVQHDQAAYTDNNYNKLGLIRGYEPLLKQAIAHQARLVILPETCARGTVTLDGSPSPSSPPSQTYPRAAWDAWVESLLRGTPTAVMIGLSTAEKGAEYNSMLLWSAEGLAGIYHKQRLVPFSEYVPRGWGGWAIRGRSLEAAGHGSQVIRLADVTIGTFICQEVLYSWVTRQSVREGATLLVSGGNDGVFGNPAVARVHADLAQLRAVETGRSIIRAMKSGISAVIDPQGRELVRSQMDVPALLLTRATPQSALTWYVRFGNWVVRLSVLVCVIVGLLARRQQQHGP